MMCGALDQRIVSGSAAKVDMASTMIAVELLFRNAKVRHCTTLRFLKCFFDNSNIFAVIQPCSSPNSVQLRPSGIDDSGRLEICSGGRWGSVCAIGISDTIASVICRQLSYADKGIFTCSTASILSNN